ncbi:MarR family transcriptional regulator [Paenibacillus sp. HN-1]|uniref:MarR family winged helix-turn-helix transcriptional regulator n=1 Tax=Paenibacillus TaxID=44249 RepID=UPI001CA848FB|nr:MULTISPECIES: MarR family transcriptional regulator [Paenibacillus]MBY9082245.1 MarR family transcriptional regulator [Paenibacillus sp. CGMCC 1.18879]MBY9086391.1 MarR family transcriptional regulator [Paenibacillus sinensis]
MTSPTLDQSLGFLIGSAYRRLSTHYARELKPYGITPEQWTVLYTIVSYPDINQKAIASHVDKDQPTTARIVELLEKKGLITKTVSASDRRAYLLNATIEGQELLAVTRPVEQQHLNSAFAGLSDKQLKELRSMLDTIRRNTGEPYED